MVPSDWRIESDNPRVDRDSAVPFSVGSYFSKQGQLLMISGFFVTVFCDMVCMKKVILPKGLNSI